MAINDFHSSAFRTASSPPPFRLFRRAAPSTIRRRFSASSTSTATLSPWRHTIAAMPTAPMKTGGEHRSGGRGRLLMFNTFKTDVSDVVAKCFKTDLIVFHHFNS
uniref:Uncharacterized protein n=1 Tax=Oryza meridionalis TaxID=40149 RepID=A0A0E0C314_9ORYZ